MSGSKAKGNMGGETSLLEGCIAIGPWGISDRPAWSYKINNGAFLRRIILRHGLAIHSITFVTEELSGKTTVSDRFGGSGGHQTIEIDIGPTEYLTTIEDSYRWVQDCVKSVVTSLTFHTNFVKYGPYRKPLGSYFSLDMEGSVVVGFHGRGDHFLEAIGLYIKPYHQPEEEVKSKHILTNKYEEIENVVHVVGPRAAGPWGGPRGKPWDDGVFAAVKQVYLYEGNGIIQAIQFQYQKSSGEVVSSEVHGGVTADNLIHRINLESANEQEEFLVRLEGFYGHFEGDDVVKSLMFYTNKGRYGPFGSQVGVYFASASGGKVLGFSCRSSSHLDALGVHVEYA